MTRLFIHVFNMSVTAAYVIGVVLLLRLLLGKRLPKLFSYALWGLVLLRLLVPVSFPSALSVLNFLRAPAPAQTGMMEYMPQNIGMMAEPRINAGAVAVDSLPAPGAEHVTSANPMQILLFIAALAWAGVAALLLLGCAISYGMVAGRVKAAVFYRDNVFLADGIKSPFVFGLIRPRILLPSDIAAQCGEEEIGCIIAHEQVHIRRLDHITKLLSVAVLAVYWFNPAVWLAFFLSDKDRELACDEGVMRQFPGDIRARYAHALVSMGIHKGNPLGTLAFGESNIKSRVKSIVRFKRPALWASLAAVLVAVAAGAVCLTNPRPGPSVRAPEPLEAVRTRYDHVKVTLLSEMMGFKETDEFESDDIRIVAAVDSMIKSAVPYREEPPELESNRLDRYTVALSSGAGGYSCGVYYDSLYNKAYVVKDGGPYSIAPDAVRYIDSLLENNGLSADMDPDAAALFREHGWTLDYRISALTVKMDLPGFLADFDPDAYYFAYHNELSKDIGLDMSKYANKDVEIDIYRIREEMPPKENPNKNTRGIVVRNQKGIVGAYISAGRHGTFSACSLKGRFFEEVTGGDFNQWLAKRVRPGREERDRAAHTPEQVIETYFRALGKRDASTAKSCVLREEMLGGLSANMLNHQLFHEAFSLPLTNATYDINVKDDFGNLKDARLVEIRSAPSGDDTETVKTFTVTVNLAYSPDEYQMSGEQVWSCRMVYETPRTGWKIAGFGHG